MTRALRVNVDEPAILVAADGHEARVVIKDVSATGFRIEHFDDLEPGDVVTFRLGKGETIAARIQWSLGNEAGGQFLDGCPLADLPGSG